MTERQSPSERAADWRAWAGRREGAGARVAGCAEGGAGGALTGLHVFFNGPPQLPLRWSLATGPCLWRTRSPIV